MEDKQVDVLGRTRVAVNVEVSWRLCAGLREPPNSSGFWMRFQVRLLGSSLALGSLRGTSTDFNVVLLLDSEVWADRARTIRCAQLAPAPP